MVVGVVGVGGGTTFALPKMCPQTNMKALSLIMLTGESNKEIY